MSFPPTRRIFDEALRQHYAALYARPGAMHAGFAQFASFDHDAIDNKAFLSEGKLAIPVLAIGGEKIIWHDDGNRCPFRRHRR